MGEPEQPRNRHAKRLTHRYYRCSHCQDFEAEYNKARRLLCALQRLACLTNQRCAQVGAHFAQSALQRVARVDVHEHRHLASEQNLTGLPTFVLFPRGTLHRVRQPAFSQRIS